MSRTVLITGASQGIGEGLAHAFAAEGCPLHLTARSADKLDALKRAIEAEHRVAVGVTAIDMTQDGACERIVEEAGDVDILINNAGVIPSGSLFDIGAQRWREGWALKGFGYADMIRDLGRKSQLIVITHNRATMAAADNYRGASCRALPWR